MKYKLLGMNTEEHINIGDYVQALASNQFLPHLDGFIQRERLDEYTEDRSKIIMNGWYMHHPQHWPPTEQLHPLFVAFHINSSVENQMLSNKSIAYLRQHQPIGCRDERTRDLLKSKGIDAYFSGCMTLTLGEKYKHNGTRDGIYFVDVPVLYGTSFMERLKDLITGLYKQKLAKSIAKKYYNVERVSLRQIKGIGGFLRLYGTIFSDDVLAKASFLHHVFRNNGATDAELLRHAEDLVLKYSKAQLIVTTRIHCALPCLGMDTPVIYIDDPAQGKVSTCRLDGLRQLFNCLRVSGKKIYLSDQFNPGKITLNHIPSNKPNWKVLASTLIAKCNDFIASDSE
jgi:hypothetical protein